jgi:hypothetical protein
MKVYLLFEFYGDMNGERTTVLGVYADKTAADQEESEWTGRFEADRAKQPYDSNDPPQFSYVYGVQEFEVTA